MQIYSHCVASKAINVNNDINEVKRCSVENGNYSFRDICEYNENIDFNFFHHFTLKSFILKAYKEMIIINYPTKQKRQQAFSMILIQ